MKRLFKQVARHLWRMSASVRRPLIHKFDCHMMQLLHPFSTPTVPLAPPPPAASADLDMALNSVVRELARIQMQVEALQQQIDEWPSSDRDGGRAQGRLSVVAEIG
jgi:hypothetical protein